VEPDTLTHHRLLVALGLSLNLLDKHCYVILGNPNNDSVEGSGRHIHGGCH
jgi:hypothetical protein